MTTIKLQKPTGPALGGAGGVKLQRAKSNKLSFASLFGDPPAEPMPNPLDSAPYPGGDDVEGDVLVEAQVIREAFQAKYRGELDNFRAQDDMDYWFLVCFQTRQQKDEFLEAVNWIKFGGHRYLNGLALAKAVGVDIQPVQLRRQVAKPVSKILSTEVQDAE